MLRDAAEADSERAGALVKAAQRSMTAARLTAMLDVAEPHIAVATADLDADPWLLNVRNGVVDLRTGELLDHDPNLLLTRQAGASYDPAAEPTAWLRFLDEIIPDSDERDFLQRLFGSALVGVQRDHILPIFYGVGANGKTTFVAGIRAALGSYAVKIPTSVLVGRGPDRGSATPELVKLRGARFVVADEPEAGARLRESHVKALTGSDRITARALYSDPIEFDPTHTLALVTNHRPQVQGTDEGIWRRLLLIPFTVTIPPADQDPDLAMKLAAEADGILAWTIAGCLEWQDRGLDPPVAVTAATATYRSEQDHVASFIDDECVLGDQVRAPAGQLYRAYRDWCEVNGLEPLTATAFGTDLTDRGFGRKKHGGRIHRLGITTTERGGRPTESSAEPSPTVPKAASDSPSPEQGTADFGDSWGQSGQESPARARKESSAKPSPTVPNPDDSEPHTWPEPDEEEL
jgi:putative DNA primase/helicase